MQTRQKQMPRFYKGGVKTMTDKQRLKHWVIYKNTR